jgi:hypothetical protein
MNHALEKKFFENNHYLKKCKRGKAQSRCVPSGIDAIKPFCMSFKHFGNRLEHLSELFAIQGKEISYDLSGV